MSDKIIDKNYGSIPHLSTSKMSQQADKKISEGQEKILTEKTRDWRDLIIITEKLDGSNVGVVRKNGVLNYITRAGYPADSSRFKQHHYFARWAEENKKMFGWLPENTRVCGEWLAMAHGTKYNISDESPFMAFDIIGSNNERLNYLDFISICAIYEIPTVELLHIGQPVSIKNAVKLLGGGHYGNPEKPEGVVYRCERLGKVDFMAKYVRSDKEDGKYMKDEIYNIGFGGIDE